MSEFKGTKGKWYVDNEESGYNEHNQLCTAISVKGIINFCEIFGDDEQSKANALLISKAPEMLEMLQLILLGNCMREEIEELIKEATEI